MNNLCLTVFEHQAVRVGQYVNSSVFEHKHLEALQKFHGLGVPYFSLIHNGIKFNEFVGVLQVGQLTIEVLPKADRGTDKEKWRKVLLGILMVAGVIDVHSPSSSLLKLKTNSILDFYIELFVLEMEYLLHQGLVKRYRKTESNLTTLKGCIQFSKHIRTNVVHREKFYVKHTIYDHNHLLNMILHKTIKLVSRVNTNVALKSRIGSLLLSFPSLGDWRVNEEQFGRIIFDRKTEQYRKAVGIAKLLLLNFHPDVVKGKEHVLAIMFDMNVLWERFVYRSLQKFNNGTTTIESKFTKDFWKPESGLNVRLIPDIVINRGKVNCMVLDTKWKNLDSLKPSSEDLRQMYTYSNYYQARRTALIYPGTIERISHGLFYDSSGVLKDQSCGVIALPVEQNIRQWQKNIA
ncbi:MAG TPA: hypothetical protein VK666_01465, partial [Chryseolinea sp.]|nr:hypothetical protein [Chryseolinea sp.]